MKNFKYTPEHLYENTNKGLDIILKYLPQAVGCENGKKPFKLREDERSESAYILELKDVFVVKDFGDKSYNPISLVMYLTGLGFLDTLKRLYSEFNLLENGNFSSANTTFEDTDLEVGHFEIVYHDEHQNLDIICQFLTPEVAEYYHFKSVAKYSFVFINKKTDRKTLCITESTDQFPIFAYQPEESWAKIYQPFDNKYKHGYVGKKPERFVHGLEQLKEKFEKVKEETDFDSISEQENFKLENVIICTGGSDGLSVASLGYDVIWFNSESEQINHEEFNLLRSLCHNIYNLPDIDKPGTKYAYEVALEHWTINTIWLPEVIKNRNGKDFRDWLRYYSKLPYARLQDKFASLLPSALRIKFFQKHKETYKIRLSYLLYFLNSQGFYTYKLENKHLEISANEEVVFIRIVGNVVHRVSPREIRKFCLDYIREKGQPVQVLDLILSTTFLNENNLMGLSPIELDFKNHTSNEQYYFFKNIIAKVTSDKIDLIQHGKFTNYVWANSVLDFNLTSENPFFKITNSDDGADIEILRNDCMYFNYLINASRVFWRKELEEQFENSTEDKRIAYCNENKFNIAGDYLTEDEKKIQKYHLINKIYAIGYILHRYKQEDYSKCIYVMDDTPKDSDEDANGRTGKSVMFKGVDKMLTNRFLIDGKNKSITQDKHIFHGLTKFNEYIQIDDADKYLDFKFFYTKITNSIVVNPKNTQPYEIPFEVAPKIVYITNYGIPNLTGSDMGRILFVSFSDYYHAKTEGYIEERRISHDFGGKNLYSDFDSVQWNIFYNFMLQCLQFYLQNRSKEFTAPINNIEINNLRASMGDNFIDWANGYFNEDVFNTYIPRKEIQDDYMQKAGRAAKSPNAFKKALKSYCQMKGWVFNPKELLGSDNTIKRELPRTGPHEKRQIVEHFYFKTNDNTIAIEEVKQPEQQHFTEFDDETEELGI